MKARSIISWILRIVSAVILLQTLFFKFTAHPESVAIFSKLGIEPWGRIGTGVAELVTGILLLIPATAFIGACMGMGVMAGAIASHVFVLGIESAGDGGQLFVYANVVFFSCLVVALLHRQQGAGILARLLGKKVLINSAKN